MMTNKQQAWPWGVTERYLRDWADSAERAGDGETMWIALVALGEREQVPDDARYTVSWDSRRGQYGTRRISTLTQSGAARIASRWS